MRRWIALLGFVPLTAAIGVTNASAVAPSLSTSGFTCTATSSAVVCSGKIPSWDGVPLDADLTLPPGPVHPRPLIVMMHGYGSDKTEWESATPASANPNFNDYNTAWFASRGYAVLTYTARGFHGSCGQGPLTPGATNHQCDMGWTHLSDRRFEVRDTQFLAGLLADFGVADPRKIAVTGLSYGGGQSLLLALQGDETAVVPDPKDPATYDQATMIPWTSPVKHIPMHLAAAVPEYPWSDLVDSLLPNGRSSDGVILADGNRLTPIGIEKQSYVSFLFFSGNVPTGFYCPQPCPDPTADLTAWFARVNQGEPYNPATEPALASAINQLKVWRSPYYQDALMTRGSNGVPIFDIQGWTDNLFPEVQGVSLVNKLRATGWPVKIAVADVGHPLAQNKAATWSVLNAQANAFLDHFLKPNGPSINLDSSAQVTTCDSSPGATYTNAANWAGLAPFRITFASSDPKATTFVAGSDAAGSASDPILVAAAHGANGACVILPATTSSPSAVWDFPVTTAFTLLGEPALHLDTTVTGVDAEINAKLWDVSADGTSKTLVTRGAFRFSGSAGPASIGTTLQGNGWDFAVGHTLRLEVTQNDAPYLRMDNLGSAIAYTGMSLTLPTPTAPTATATTTSTGSNSSARGATVTQLAATGGGGSSAAALLLSVLFLVSGLAGWQRPPIQSTSQRREKR